MVSFFKERNIPGEFARLLAVADGWIKAGAEERLNDTVRKVTGKDPRGFRDFAESVKAVWVPTD